MHIKTKMLAFGGAAVGLSIVCMALGSIIETNTLFLLAAASYFVGILIREFDLRAGAAFYGADVLLGLFVVPNKFYVLSFAAMGLYIWLVEAMWKWFGRMPGKLQKRSIFWVIKYVIFNVMYLPMLLFFQEVLFGRTIKGGYLLIVIVAGQIGLLIYDKAYEYVQGHLWSRYRDRFIT